VWRLVTVNVSTMVVSASMEQRLPTSRENFWETFSCNEMLYWLWGNLVTNLRGGRLWDSGASAITLKQSRDSRRYHEQIYDQFHARNPPSDGEAYRWQRFEQGRRSSSRGCWRQGTHETLFFMKRYIPIMESLI